MPAHSCEWQGLDLPCSPSQIGAQVTPSMANPLEVVI